MATTVSVTFENQKNDENYETVTQHKNGHATQNPVKIWAQTVNRVLDIEGTTIDTTINAFWNPNQKRIEFLTSVQILKILKWSVDELGIDHLGFSSEDIGLHLI